MDDGLNHRPHSALLALLYALASGAPFLVCAAELVAKVYEASSRGGWPSNSDALFRSNAALQWIMGSNIAALAWWLTILSPLVLVAWLAVERPHGPALRVHRRFRLLVGWWVLSAGAAILLTCFEIAGR
jgi:hypothetical protein